MQSSRYERKYIVNQKEITFTPADWRNPSVASEKAISVVLQYHLTDADQINELKNRMNQMCESHREKGIVAENSDNFHITIGMLFPKEKELASLANILASIEEKYHHSAFELTLKAENDVFGSQDKKFPVALFTSQILNDIYKELMQQCDSKKIVFKKLGSDLNSHVSLVAKPLAEKDVNMEAIKHDCNRSEITRLVSCEQIILTYKDARGNLIKLNSQELKQLANIAALHLNTPSLYTLNSLSPIFAQQPMVPTPTTTTPTQNSDNANLNLQFKA